MSRLRSMVPAAALVAVQVLVLAGAASSAAAGSYEVVSCDAAGGANRAWKPQAGNPALFVSRQRCPALGTYDGFGMRSSTLALGASQLTGSWWRFDPPPGTSLEAIEWAGHYATSSPGWVARIETSRGTVAGCGPSPRRCERTWAHGAKPARYELHGAAWIRVGAVCLGATGCRTGDGRTTPFVDASTWFSRLIVRDPTPPTVAVPGAPSDGSWVVPGERVQVDATDSTGISSISFSDEGHELSALRFECDRTLTRPCLDRGTTFRIPESTPDGRRRFTVGAIDAAGNATERDLLIGVDGTAPTAQIAPTIDGGDGWRATPRFTLRWSLPDQGGGSPLAGAVVSVCRRAKTGTGSDCLPRQALGQGETAAAVELPDQGEWEARVLFVDSAGNRDDGQASPPVLLRWDATPPGAGRIIAPERWIGRDAARSLSLRFEIPDGSVMPASGLSGWAFSRSGIPGMAPDLDGISPDVPLDDFPEGLTEVSARAISATGIASRSVVTARVRIDETAPDVIFDGVPAGEWATAPVRVMARGRDQAGLSGMGTGEGSSAEVRLSVDGGESIVGAGDEASTVVDGDGAHTVAAEAIDAAGNSSGRRQVDVRIDSTPPDRLSFLPQDSADPRIVRVDALDRTSGIGSVTVRMRPVSGGDWVELNGQLKGERFEATIDETKLSEGLWEMEAVASDAAGNERTASRTIADDPAIVAIPLRTRTRVDATFARSASSGGAGATSMVAAHGSAVDLAGRLLDSFEQPVEGAMVTLSAAPMMVATVWSSVGHAITDRLGRFSFRLPPGPSRRVRIAFAGDHSGMPSSLDMSVRVAARTSLGVTPGAVRAGTVATFSGRLAGGMIPPGGKIVMVQALIPGHGWQTFAVARSNGAGEWSTRYRFRSAVGAAGHSIRAVVPTEAGYPFDRFTTPTIRVRGSR